MGSEREKWGGKWRAERGSVSLELIGALPIILVSVLIAVQILVAGAALWSAGVAARAGARAVIIGKQPKGAAERALPAPLRSGLKISQKKGVRVGVRVPALIPGLPETHVYGSSSLGDR